MNTECNEKGEQEDQCAHIWEDLVGWIYHDAWREWGVNGRKCTRCGKTEWVEGGQGF